MLLVETHVDRGLFTSSQNHKIWRASQAWLNRSFKLKKDIHSLFHMECTIISICTAFG